MRNYAVVVLALVAFVLVFNSINGTREEKINMKQMQMMTEHCKQQGAVYYKEPGSDGVCVKNRSEVDVR